MRPFELTRRTDLDAAETWRRVTTWERHGDAIPLTTVRRLSDPGAGRGVVFVARTSLGPLGFDDPMEVVEWEPPTDARPGFCRIEKRGRVILGWAEITVRPHSGGSTLVWRELAEVARIGRLGNAPGRLVGRWLFGRLADRLLASGS